MTNKRLGRFASFRSRSLAALQRRKTDAALFFTAETPRRRVRQKSLRLGGEHITSFGFPLEDHHEPFSYRAVFALDV
jgi:hypothetical protein